VGELKSQKDAFEKYEKNNDKRITKLEETIAQLVRERNQPINPANPAPPPIPYERRPQQHPARDRQTIAPPPISTRGDPISRPPSPVPILRKFSSSSSASLTYGGGGRQARQQPITDYRPVASGSGSYNSALTRSRDRFSYTPPIEEFEDDVNPWRS
jgi:hypothetical protein